MIPGPVEVEDEVLAAMGGQLVAHYGAEWAHYYNRIVQELRELVGTKGDVFVYPGSGHLGVDACAASLFEPGEQVVVATNGYFGERLIQLAVANELDVVRIEAPWGKAIDPAVVGAALDAHPEAKGVMVVHGETSTATLNPVREIAREVKARGRLFVVDAVSSAGVVPLEVDAWGIDAFVTASQKGLGAPPGLVIVGVGGAAWQAIDRRATPIRGWSTNLKVWKAFAEEERDFQPYYVTMPVGIVRALGASLELIRREGLTSRFSRHSEVSRAFREGITQLGLELVGDPDHPLPSVTAFCTPAGLEADHVRRMLQERGFFISNGLGAMSSKVLRVGHMGKNATLEHARAFCRVLGELLGELLR